MAKERGNILSVDIGGASCKVGHVTAKGEVHDPQYFPTSEIREQGVEGLIERLSPYVDEHSIHGVAMGIPATVDWDHNHVRSECKEIPWLEDSENKRKIQEGLGRKVLLVNDVEALLIGEWIWGELKGMSSGVVLSLGASMGSAMLWDGTPQQGRRGSIMELEHVSLNTYGEQVDNAPPGSSRQWLSGTGLERKMKEKGNLIPMKEFFSTEEEPYVKLRETFQDKLAHMLGTLVMMLDPERIVLAGGLTASYKSWFPGVKESFDRFVMKQFKGLPAVTMGRLREEDVIKGPAAFWDWKEAQ